MRHPRSSFPAPGPCINGHLSGGPSEQFPDRYWSTSLTLLADPLREAHWRHAVRGLFTALADTLGTFYASAEVTRDNIWSGRSAWADIAELAAEQQTNGDLEMGALRVRN